MDLLARIAMLKDEITALSAILEAEGLMAVGSQGQPVAHPALAQRRAAIMALYKHEAKLDDRPDDDPLADLITK